MRYLSFIWLMVMMSCVPGSNQKENISSGDLKEPLIQENKKITKEEEIRIDRYIERREWEMKKTGTGLRYMIYENGFGIQAEDGKYASVEYQIELLDGTLCYSSAENGPRRFLVGRDNIESGIHEGVKYMKVGDRAKLILPFYLAHGLVGDQNKIPPRASLVVDLKLIRLE